MKTFEWRDNQFVCKKCGSTDIRIKAGMMTDLYICNHCGNEERS